MTGLYPLVARLTQERGCDQATRHGRLALDLQTEQLLQLHDGNVWNQLIDQTSLAEPIFDDYLGLL